MADFDLTVGQGAAAPYSPPLALLFEKIVDFSVNPLAGSDTAQLFDLPAGILVIAASTKVLTAEGGVATFDLGLTGGNVDEYLDGVDANAAAGTVVMSGDAATDEPIAFANNGKYLSAAETVSLLANNAMANAKIKFSIMALDLRGMLSEA